MKILVTGAAGFVGRNLIEQFRPIEDIDVYAYDVDTDPALLDEYTKDCDFVFHLAGVNRPQNEDEFMKGNCDFTVRLIESLEANNNNAVIAVSSSIQAELDNPYGVSKRAGEDVIREHAKKAGSKAIIYRFPNLFGKWCRPNYNSAVATFCYNIARDLPIKVNDPSVMMHLVYIDDVCDEFMAVLKGEEHVMNGYGYVPTVHDVPLGRIPEMLYRFRDNRKDLGLPNLCDSFEKKLYSTYLSYLPEDDFAYPLTMHEDNRGSFTEIIKTANQGQVSVNISHPGIVKGNHWHNTKNEKFLVVSGEGLIRLRKVGESEVIEYRVNGNDLRVVDIPCGYTHSIANVGDSDMATVMWVNEIFDPNHPDTFYEEV